MTVVVDASVVIAALIDTETRGQWALDLLLNNELVAPHLMPVEVANILRAEERAGTLSPSDARAALRDLLTLPIELSPFVLVADRVWELRNNVTAYDAWFIALAETLHAPMATLDYRLTRSPGPLCEFLTPPP